MTKYRIRLANGRVIGPFSTNELFELKAKGQIKGTEEAQVFPTGSWQSITAFDFYADLMDENKTVVAPKERKDETFVIDLAKLRLDRNEKEMDELGYEPVVPVQDLTETLKISSPNPPPKKEEKPAELDPALAELLDEGDRTLINPVAQQEIEKIKRQQQKAEDDKKKREEEEARKKEEEKAALAVVKSEEVSTTESTQMFKLDKEKNDLIAESVESELVIIEEAKAVELKEVEERKRIAKEEAEEDEEEPVDPKKAKKKKIIIVAAALAIAFAFLFPDEKEKSPPFQHLEPRIVFPIPFDQSDVKKSEAELNKGIEYFKKGTYPSLIKAGEHFKASYENNIDNVQALNFLVRTYAEELKHSKQKLVDSQTLFNIVQSKRPFLLQDYNGAIGLNLFYMAINKSDAAVDVVQRYLKLKPQDVTQDLFAVYLKSLIRTGKIDLAKQFHQALVKAPEKNRYSYEALIDYAILNQEDSQALEYTDEAIKRYPDNIGFLLTKAELLLKEKKYKELVPLLKLAEEKGLEYNDSNRARYLQVKGLVYASQGNAKEATAYLTKSLELEDSPELRTKLADLSESGSGSETDKLIAESKAVKYLIQAKDFFDKKNYELAMSSAARASDTFPGHIPSELFLAKVQLKLGLALESIKTLEGLLAKYPDNKAINIALVETLVDTYKFNDAKTRIANIAGTEIRDTYEFASANAKLYLKMGDQLQSMSWLKNSISLNPLNDHDIFLLAELLIKRGSFDAARTLLHKCMELDPVNADYRIAYSDIIYETQDDQAAVGYLLGLLNEFGENPKFLSEIAIFYFRAGKVKDYLDFRKKLESLPYKDKALYEFLIKAALLDERFKEIPPLVEKLVLIEPGDLEAMMTAGRVLFEDGQLVESAKWFRRIQDKLPSYPKVLYYIAKIKYLSRDLDGAMAEIKKDIKENGENDQDLVFLAQIHQAKDEFIEAENLYKKAQKLNPKSYEALLGLADLSSKRNNFDLALDLYKRAIKLKSDEPIVHRKVGDVYRLLGQGTLAIESYKLYLEMNPEAPDKGQIEAYIQLMQ